MLNDKKYYLSDIAYLFVFFSIFNKFVYTTTLVEYAPFVSTIFGKITLLLRLVLILCVAIILIAERTPLYRCVNILILLFLAVLQYLYIEEWLLFDVFFVLICFGKKLDYKKVYEMVYNITFYGLLIVFFLNMIGIMPDANYYRGNGQMRYTFGFNHPNALSAQILIFTIFYVLRKDIIRYRDIAIVFACGIFVYLFPNSITASASILLLATGMLVVKIGFKPLILKVMKKKKIVVSLVVFGFTGFIALIYAIALKGVARDFLAGISGTFYSRFIYGQKAIEEYGFSLFGQYVKMVSERMIAQDPSLTYFNIDSAYFYLPIVIGIVPSVYYFLWYIKSLSLCVSSKNIRLMGALIVVAIYSVSETVFLSYIMCLFVGALGKDDKKINQENIVPRKVFVR